MYFHNYNAEINIRSTAVNFKNLCNTFNIVNHRKKTPSNLIMFSLFKISCLHFLFKVLAWLVCAKQDHFPIRCINQELVSKMDSVLFMQRFQKCKNVNTLNTALKANGAMFLTSDVCSESRKF